MSRTVQQQAVIDAAKDPTIPMISCKAVAGAGKTFTLLELAKELNPATGLYLAYNRGIADEAEEKFKDTNIKCVTLHSLAWNATVRQYGLKVGFFGVRDVSPSSLTYPMRQRVVDAVEGFCLSAHTDPLSWMEENGVYPTEIPIVMEHLNKMTTGAISCTHSFYMKLYHVYLLSGEIPIPEVDMLLMDEAGDLTKLTIDIFRLIKAPKKIAVGDPMQNIYSFNQTVNAFNVLTECIPVNLTASFRVSNHIAAKIQSFVQKHMDASFEFTGRDYEPNTAITTSAYIARNNSGLLEEMFVLMAAGTKFHTTRKVELILELPLILANLSNGKAITEYKYKHIEKLRKEYMNSSYLASRGTIGSYVRQGCAKDPEVSRAITTVMKYTPVLLNELVKYAKECAKTSCGLTLTTAHSSKGLEFSEVTIAPDLNASATEALVDIMRAKLDKDWKKAEMLSEELRLYYVATSRSMIKLNNARLLK